MSACHVHVLITLALSILICTVVDDRCAASTLQLFPFLDAPLIFLHSLSQLHTISLPPLSLFHHGLYPCSAGVIRHHCRLVSEKFDLYFLLSPLPRKSIDRLGVTLLREAQLCASFIRSHYVSEYMFLILSVHLYWRFMSSASTITIYCVFFLDSGLSYRPCQPPISPYLISLSSQQVTRSRVSVKVCSFVLPRHRILRLVANRLRLHVSLPGSLHRLCVGKRKRYCYPPR